MEIAFFPQAESSDNLHVWTYVMFPHLSLDDMDYRLKITLDINNDYFYIYPIL
jgi:hypothetical protein